jgi:hypothetical protein
VHGRRGVLHFPELNFRMSSMNPLCSIPGKVRARVAR